LINRLFSPTSSSFSDSEYSLLARAFCFSYSVRPGTPAQPWAETVSDEVKHQRVVKLIAEVKRMAIARSERFVGRTMEVLVEGPSRTNPDILTGRIRHNNVVNFAGNARPGDLVAVEILSTQNGFSLHGRLR
jgi:tRNA-2-methylthio-N6-dimethylallyladenosine synthase